MLNEIEHLKNVINETEIIKSNIDELLNSYENKYDEIIKIQNNLKVELSELEKKRSEQFKDGVLLDYKTFTEIVNVLSIAKSYGDCSQEFFDKVIQIGQRHESKKEVTNNYRNGNYKNTLTLEPVENNTKVVSFDDLILQLLNEKLNEQKYKNFR